MECRERKGNKKLKLKQKNGGEKERERGSNGVEGDKGLKNAVICLGNQKA